MYLSLFFCLLVFLTACFWRNKDAYISYTTLKQRQYVSVALLKRSDQIRFICDKGPLTHH